MTTLSDKFEALRAALRAFQDEDNGWLESVYNEIVDVRGFTYLTDEDIKAQKPILEAIRDNTATPVGSTDMTATNSLLSDIRQALGANGVIAQLLQGQQQDLTNMAARLASIDAGMGVLIDWYYDWERYTENSTAAVMQAAQMAAVERLQHILQSLSSGTVHPEGGRTVIELLNSIDANAIEDPGPVLANIAERQDETLDALATLQTTMDDCCDDSGGGGDLDPCIDATGEIAGVHANNPISSIVYHLNPGSAGVQNVYGVVFPGYVAPIQTTPITGAGQYAQDSEGIIYPKGELIDAVRNDGGAILSFMSWNPTMTYGPEYGYVSPGECVALPRAVDQTIWFYVNANEEITTFDCKLLQVAVG